MTCRLEQVYEVRGTAALVPRDQALVWDAYSDLVSVAVKLRATNDRRVRDDVWVAYQRAIRDLVERTVGVDGPLHEFLVGLLADHDDRDVRIALAEADVPANLGIRLDQDPDSEVRTVRAGRCAVGRLEQFADDQSTRVLAAVLEHDDCPAAVVTVVAANLMEDLDEAGHGRLRPVLGPAITKLGAHRNTSDEVLVGLPASHVPASRLEGSERQRIGAGIVAEGFTGTFGELRELVELIVDGRMQEERAPARSRTSESGIQVASSSKPQLEGT